MAGALDVYVKNVLTFTASGSSTELVELNRKAVGDVLEKNVAHLNRVLETLSVEEHSLSVVAVLLAKMNQPWNNANADRISKTLSQIELSLPLLNTSQLQLASDLFISLLRKVSQYCLRKNEQAVVVRGIRLLLSALSVFAPEPGVLTSLHAHLFCLCLKANIYEPALPFLESPVTKIFKENPSSNVAYVDSRWVLLYFYYGGLIFGTLGRFRECLLMLENVLCVPSVAVSAIVVEAYKKYVLISMILYGKVIALPSYRAAMIPRTVKRLCADYTAVETLSQNKERGPDVAGALLQHLEQHRAVFEADGNVGLMKRLIRKIRENSVLKIAKCFSTISVDDFVRRCYLQNAEHAERYLMDMSRERKIIVRIDKQHQIIYVDEVKTEVDEGQVEQALRRVLELDKLLAEFDVRLRTNPIYVSRSSKASVYAAAAHDDEGFQQGPPLPHAIPMQPSGSGITESSAVDMLWPS
ncbi:COP9 signalosome complex subunit 3 [Toxocara canis]|uniref:COP9 signalosome complex subunit 3 n=1 Tax=Toxocara canis TaxID=6265 RepID=A0A0B2VH37_TOXCA|nr:COP9 signalosome complex subunit 3 [Toxocara canis]